MAVAVVERRSKYNWKVVSHEGKGWAGLSRSDWDWCWLLVKSKVLMINRPPRLLPVNQPGNFLSLPAFIKQQPINWLRQVASQWQSQAVCKPWVMLVVVNDKKIQSAPAWEEKNQTAFCNLFFMYYQFKIHPFGPFLFWIWFDLKPYLNNKTW